MVLQRDRADIDRLPGAAGANLARRYLEGAASVGAADRPELLVLFADPANTSPRPDKT